MEVQARNRRINQYGISLPEENKSGSNVLKNNGCHLCQFDSKIEKRKWPCGHILLFTFIEEESRKDLTDTISLLPEVSECPICKEQTRRLPI